MDKLQSLLSDPALSLALDAFCEFKELPGAKRYRAESLLSVGGRWQRVATSGEVSFGHEQDLIDAGNLFSSFRKEHEAKGCRVEFHDDSYEGNGIYLTAEMFIPATEKELQEARDIIAQPDSLAPQTIKWLRPISFDVFQAHPGPALKTENQE